MGNVYIVFDFHTPSGYLPFCYTKSNISKILKQANTNEFSYENIFEGNRKILTFNLDERSINDDNIYVILIDNKIREINLTEILSEKLLNLINKSDNFIIHYFDYGTEEMRSLI